MSLHYDAKSDLWSVATIVYQCLTGRAPFIASTPQQLRQLYERSAQLQPRQSWLITNPVIIIVVITTLMIITIVLLLSLLLLLGCIAVLCVQMWLIVTDGVVWSVDLSQLRAQQKGLTCQYAIWLLGSRKHILDGVQISVCKGTIFRGKEGGPL